MHRWRFLFVAAAVLFLAVGYWNATRMPVVRRGTVWVNGWSANKPPVRIVLISDIHVAGPDMPPSRVARIVDQINALKPDLVLIAGDLVSARLLTTRRYSFDEALAPLTALHAPRIAVLGNHDHRRGAADARRALAAAHIPLLENRIVRFRGLTIVGLDDMYTGIPDARLFAKPLPQPVLLLTHSPEVVRRLPPGERLVLAGHTHCGQVVIPGVGALVSLRKGRRTVACGIVHRNGRNFVVTGGLGASIVPIRYGATPDLWLLTFQPKPSHL
ncbi:metallophosphoesterase [Sphingomonas tabacisoli]|uniref:Metallophosphoesterase n=1 Tax=Sphingomonas tabacisoli TaxID=2249466 RepID=A0ABW4HZC9_9SPHN